MLIALLLASSLEHAHLGHKSHPDDAYLGQMSEHFSEDFAHMNRSPLGTFRSLHAGAWEQCYRPKHGPSQRYMGLLGIIRSLKAGSWIHP